MLGPGAYRVGEEERAEVDGGPGAGFGININSTDDEIQQVADTFRQACGV